MARKSSVKTKLPPSVLRELDAKLMRGHLTIDQLLEFLHGKVEAPPSRSALGRYAKNFEATAKALRESREAAKALAQEMGPDSVEGEQGRLLVEMLRGLVFDVIFDLKGDPEAKVDVEKLQRLSRTLKELSHSMHLEQDFAKRIKEETRKEVEAEVKARVGKLGSAEELKKLSNEELERKIAELAAG